MWKRITEKNKLIYTGILLGIAYGVLTRFVFGKEATLVSLTYLFLVPAVLGVIPLIFADDNQIKSYKTIIFIPWLTVISAFLIMYLLGWEESLCFLVLGGPFFVLATIGALVYRLIRIHKDKKKRNIFLTMVLVPFLLSPIEERFENVSAEFEVRSETIIYATPELVWDNIIRVLPIEKSEYSPGIFNRLGVPRPVEAELHSAGPGALRIGRFEGGLTFIERITDWQPNRRVSFDIKVDPGTIGNKVFDKHVLEGGYFRFADATYEIERIDEQKIRLRLVSSYTLTSKVNFYNKFWGNLFLMDFQDRLLQVIKHRCDR